MMGMTVLGYVVAFIGGWLVKGALDRAIVNIGVRILTSSYGKEKVLEMLEDGVRKMKAKGE